MAKGSKKVTVEVNAVQASPQPTGPDCWQTREDVNDLIRTATLRKDKKRYNRAIDVMRSVVDGEKRGGVRMKSNRGRRTAARNIGKR